MIEQYSNLLAQGIFMALLVVFTFVVVYGIFDKINTKYFFPYKCSLRFYKKCLFPYAGTPKYIECKQIHLSKCALDEMFKKHPERINIENYVIIYTYTFEEEYYAILLPCRKDYNQFVKKYNEYTNLKETERKQNEEEENINKVLDDAYDVAR